MTKQEKARVILIKHISKTMIIISKMSDNLKNSAIFKMDAALLVSLGRLALMFQVFSGVSEYIGLASYLTNVTGTASSGKFIAAVISIAIELSNLKLLTYIINCLYFRYMWDKELAINQKIGNWIKFLLAVGLLVFMVWVSVTVSKMNIKKETEFNGVVVETVDVSQYDQQQKERFADIDESYNIDYNRLTANYNQTVKVVNAQFDSETAPLKVVYGRWERKEKRDGKSYASQKNIRTDKIAAIEVKRTAKLSQLLESYNQELKSIKTIRNQDKSVVKTDVAFLKQKAIDGNTKREGDAVGYNAWFSYFLSAFAAYSVFGFVIAHSWAELSRLTAGIERNVYVTPEMFESSVWKELYVLITLVPGRLFRNLIRRGLAKISDLRSIDETGAFLDTGANQRAKTAAEQELERERAERQELEKQLQDQQRQQELERQQFERDQKAKKAAEQERQQKAALEKKLQIANQNATERQQRLLQVQKEAELQIKAQQATYEKELALVKAKAAQEAALKNEEIQKELQAQRVLADKKIKEAEEAKANALAVQQNNERILAQQQEKERQQKAVQQRQQQEKERQQKEEEARQQKEDEARQQKDSKKAKARQQTNKKEIVYKPATLDGVIGVYKDDKFYSRAKVNSTLSSLRSYIGKMQVGKIVMKGEVTGTCEIGAEMVDGRKISTAKASLRKWQKAMEAMDSNSVLRVAA